MRTEQAALLKTLSLRPTGDIGGFTFYTRQGLRTVFYLKAPPKKPAAYWQRVQRNKWRSAAQLWRQLSPTSRRNWERLAREAQIRITGYNLWIHALCCPHATYIKTIRAKSALSDADLFT